MKPSIFTLVIALTLFSCKNEMDQSAYPVTNHKSPTSQTLEGAWELVGFYNYVDNKVSDSFKTQEGYRQVKIYSPTKVMWSKQVPTDSTEWFGYGTYRIEDGKLIEVLDYGSKMMSKIIQEREEFVYELHLSKGKFSQIEIGEDGSWIYSENYRRIE